jgi:hypothetical protein
LRATPIRKAGSPSTRDLTIPNAKFFSNTEALAYVRSFDLGGQSAKFDAVVPASSFSAQALVNGLPAERQMSGLNDPRFRLSVNFFGAPALSARDFASYHQDLIVGGRDSSHGLPGPRRTRLTAPGKSKTSFLPAPKLVPWRKSLRKAVDTLMC